jgi:hypothetical protein
VTPLSVSLKRWTWLLPTMLVGLVAVAGLAALHQRAADAGRAEGQAAARLQVQLHHLPRLAATTRSAAVVEQRLRATRGRLAAGAAAVARAERAQATAVARERLLGAALAALVALAFGAFALRPSRRPSLAAISDDGVVVRLDDAVRGDEAIAA